MQLLRLSGRKVCERVRGKGRVWKGKHMLIRWMTGPPAHPMVNPDLVAMYMGTLASTKLDKSAVRRNRMRRRCREALRISLRERTGLPTIQLLLSPRSSSLKCNFAEISSDICTFLSSLAP